DQVGDSDITDNGSLISLLTDAEVQGSGGLALGVGSTTTGKLVLRNSTNANTITLQSGITGSNLTFTLPTADGSNGDCLKTNASGVLSFGTCLSGAGAGGGVSSLNTLVGALTLAGTSHQINVSNGVSTITLSTPQDIDTTSSPSFAG